MASSPSTSPGPRHGPDRQPNTAFRELRGRLSPREFAAAVRRAAREIGEQVSCDARYIGRVESGEIRCPNYAYERVFLHMFPGRTLADLGFAPRQTVRGRRRASPSPARVYGGDPPPSPTYAIEVPPTPGPYPIDEESDVRRRAFMTGAPALAALPLGEAPAHAASGPEQAGTPGSLGVLSEGVHKAGGGEAAAVERAVRQIRLLDDRHGADGLYQRAGDSLRAAYHLLDTGSPNAEVSRRLHHGAGELAISVGWLAHDSGRLDDARSHYAEALATARLAGDGGLEAHAFCNAAFLARDAGRHRESVRAAQAGQQAARSLGSPRLLSLLTLREAGGWAGLGDRGACQEALNRAHHHFERGPGEADPEWMTFFGAAELHGLEAQCWSALTEWGRAAEHARKAVDLQDPHFVRNTALFTAELAGDLAGAGVADEAAAEGNRVLGLLGEVRSTRIRGMLRVAAHRLDQHRGQPEVRRFLRRLRQRTA
ncbi:tetratricopeptide repeat protein [Streptomyces sp. NPDC005438]|uniref:tetratricopeptide repeat protein n=1 Tax=Streptomyces sp. NPDC005438 TaxID=3156880 RepID=UPI0033A16D7B